MSLGAAGLANFSAKHAELFPAARRLLREHGITGCQTFLFAPPAVSKPSLVLTCAIPKLLGGGEALPSILRSDRIGQQWEQLIASVHDAAATKSNPWWSTITAEGTSPEAEEKGED